MHTLLTFNLLLITSLVTKHKQGLNNDTIEPKERNETKETLLYEYPG